MALNPYELAFAQLALHAAKTVLLVDTSLRCVQLQAANDELQAGLEGTFLGKLLNEVLPADLFEQTRAKLEIAKESGKEIRLEFTGYPSKDRWLRGHASYLDHPDQPLYLISVRDISMERHTQAALRYHADFDALLVNATSTLIQSSEENFDTALSTVLAQIGAFAKVDRAYYFQFSEEGNMSNTHEWCAEGVSAERDNLQDIPCAIFPEWMKTLEANEAVYIPDVQSLSPDWQAEKDILEPQGVQSLLALPVAAGGRLYGFMGFDAVHTRVVWNQSKRHLLTILGHNLGSVIMRNQQSQHLRAAAAQAQQLAEEATAANRHKSDFLANMSHEIRTPLNGVIGFTDLLHETGLNDLQQQYIEKVRKSAQSLLELINQILDFSKIEAGKMELDIDRCDLIEIAEKTCSLVRHAADNKQVNLLLDIDPAMPRYFQADVVRLQQVIANLLSNAVKFTEKGTVSLRIGYQPASSDGIAHLQFAVTDTGIGIAAEHQKHIFQAFRQADTTTTRKYGGTGLGLAICSSLLQMMHSRLELESTPGKGSTFYFELQLPCSTEPAFNPGRPAAINKVLVVDEHADARRIIASWLRHKQLAVTEAKSATEALTLLATQKDIDLAIISNELPVIKGNQLLEMIRRELQLDAAVLPVLLLCGAESVTVDTDATATILAKPLLPSQLYQALEQLHTTPPAPMPEAPEAPEAIQPATAPAKAKKILIAEDNMTNLLYTRIMAERVFPNCEIQVARNGREAIIAFEKHQPDLVLMDIQMPEMDGDAATIAIRKMEAEQGTRHTPIVALTAHAIKGVKEQYLEVGFDAYLSKPTTKEDMQQLLEQFAG